MAGGELVGYARPLTDDGRVYDEISRKVCDFIWQNVVENHLLLDASRESSGTQIEIEAKWGQIQDRRNGMRLQGIHSTECVVRDGDLEHTKFESTMSIEQHRRMNNFLNSHVQASKRPGAMRAEVNYKHIRESDTFYNLDQAGYSDLPQLTRELLSGGSRHKIRITRDAKTGQILRAIIKHRVANIEISSPQTEWDYRISVNLEIDYPGPVDELSPAVEPGRSVEAMERKKDRVSYSWLEGAYQVDLTQVTQATSKNHELELELDSEVLVNAANRIKMGQESEYENLVIGMMNNLRVLSREITPQS